jgi:hypothetical protein
MVSVPSGGIGKIGRGKREGCEKQRKRKNGKSKIKNASSIIKWCK